MLQAIASPAPQHRHRLPNLVNKLNQQQLPATPEDDKADNSVLPNLHTTVLICLILAASVFCLYWISGYAGEKISLAGHTMDTSTRRIVIKSDVITAPANMIRYPSQRRLIESNRLDLYLHWPSMEGYSEARNSSFNNVEDSSDIVFVSLAPRFSAFDMTARIDPIYRKFFIGSPKEIGNELLAHDLDPKAGFIDEYLIVQKNSPYPFSARCVRAVDGWTKPYCIRDIHIGNNLSLTYRFHKKLIKNWLALDQTVRKKFKAMID